MSSYTITYANPSFPAENLDAEGYQFHDDGDFIDFLDSDGCVFSVATIGVLSIRRN